MAFSPDQKFGLRQFVWLLWKVDPKETFLNLVPFVGVFMIEAGRGLQ